MISQQQLADITKALSYIEGRVTEPNGYHIDIKDATDVNSPYKEGFYTGHDFHLAIKLIKAMLKVHHAEPLPPSDELPDYGQIPIGESLSANYAFSPASSVNAFFVARRAAEFASVMRRRKSKDYFRYQKNENGNKIGAPFVWENLDAGKDYLILATMLEILAMSLGAAVINPDADIQQPYSYFEEVLTLPTTPPVPDGDMDVLKREVARLTLENERLSNENRALNSKLMTLENRRTNARAYLDSALSELQGEANPTMLAK